MIVDAQTLQLLSVIGIAAAVLLWWVPNPKCVCEKCAFHVNEKRMEAIRQKELQHEVQHRGTGYRGAMNGPDPNSPDRWDCADMYCDRNKMNRPPKVD